MEAIAIVCGFVALFALIMYSSASYDAKELRARIFEERNERDDLKHRLERAESKAEARLKVLKKLHGIVGRELPPEVKIDLHTVTTA